jgi:hypothetical protein
MKIRPIPFSTEIVQAILDGRKIMTRRIMKLLPRVASTVDKCGELIKEYKFYDLCPYGNIGDVLWVKENFFKHEKNPGQFHYVADYENPEAFDATGWKKVPSRFMPKVAARIFLKITDLRVERLQDISEDDVKKEGVDWFNDNGVDHFLIYSPKDKRKGVYAGPCRIDGTVVSKKSAFLNDKPAWYSFRSLWRQINGDDSWDANPWVWVISFERCEKPEGF